jgi:hypothetical protein
MTNQFIDHLTMLLATKRDFNVNITIHEVSLGRTSDYIMNREQSRVLLGGTMSDEQAKLIYRLSQVYYVLYTEKDGKSTLTLRKEPFDITMNTLSKPCRYIKYDSQGKNVDLRDGIMPKVDLIKYECTDEYVNLPQIMTDTVNISNNGSDSLPMTKKQFTQYVTLPSKFTHGNKYIVLNTKDRVDVRCNNYIKENFVLSTTASFWFTIAHRHVTIYDIQIPESYPLDKDIIAAINSQIGSVLYLPISGTNVMNHITKIKQSIDMPIKVEFTY